MTITTQVSVDSECCHTIDIAPEESPEYANTQIMAGKTDGFDQTFHLTLIGKATNTNEP